MRRIHNPHHLLFISARGNENTRCGISTASQGAISQRKDISHRLPYLIQGYSFPFTFYEGTSLATASTHDRPAHDTCKERQSLWGCSQCNHSNSVRASKCKLCGAARRGALWLCGNSKSCGTLNSRKYPQCAECGAAFRGTKPWVCSGCFSENLRLAYICRDCKIPQSPSWGCSACGTTCSVFDSHCTQCHTASHVQVRGGKALPSCLHCGERVLPSAVFCHVCGGAQLREDLSSPRNSVASHESSHLSGSATETAAAVAVAAADTPATCARESVSVVSNGEPSPCPAEQQSAYGSHGEEHPQCEEEKQDKKHSAATVTESSSKSGGVGTRGPDCDGGSPQTPVQSTAAAEFKWVCSQCKETNFKQLDNCRFCGKLRVESVYKAKARADWFCKACAQMGVLGEATCRHCGAEASPTISNCQRCNASSQPFRKPCTQCGAVTCPTVACCGCGRLTPVTEDGKCMHCLGPFSKKVTSHICWQCGTRNETRTCKYCGKNNSSHIWLCPSPCGKANVIERVFCRTCFEAKPKNPQQVPSWWQCVSEKCGCYNSAIRATCRLCSSPRSFGSSLVLCPACRQQTLWGPSQLCNVCGSRLGGTASASKADDDSLLKELSRSAASDQKTGGESVAKQTGRLCSLCGTQNASNLSECLKCGLPL